MPHSLPAHGTGDTRLQGGGADCEKRGERVRNLQRVGGVCDAATVLLVCCFAAVLHAFFLLVFPRQRSC